MKSRHTPGLAVGPLAVALVLSLLTLIDPSMGTLDMRLRDALDTLVSHQPPDPKLVIIQLDSDSQAQTGQWPWPRYILANLILDLKDYGSTGLVFDIPMDQAQAAGSSAEDTGFWRARMLDRLDQIQQERSRRLISAREARDEITQELSRGLHGMIRDNDTALASAFSLFGRIFIPYGIKQTSQNDTDSARNLALALEVQPYYKVEGDLSSILRMSGGISRAALEVFTRSSTGAGFDGFEADPDGKTRRTAILGISEGKVFAQLGFRAVLETWGNPHLQIGPEGINVLFSQRGSPAMKSPDIIIPLDQKGRFVLDRIPASQGSFVTLKASEVLHQDRLEQACLAWVMDLDKKGFLALVQASDMARLPDQLARLKRQALEEGDPAVWFTYQSLRAELADRITGLLQSDISRLVHQDLDQALAAPDLSARRRKMLTAQKAAFDTAIGTLEQEWKEYQENRQHFSRTLKDAWVLMAPPQNPDGSSSLALDQANLMNTLLQGRMHIESPPWAALAILYLSLLLIYLVHWRAKTTLKAIGSGLATLCIVSGSQTALYLGMGLYSGVLVPFLGISMALVWLGLFRLGSRAWDKHKFRKTYAFHLPPQELAAYANQPDSPEFKCHQGTATVLVLHIKDLEVRADSLSPEEFLSAEADLSGMIGKVVREKGGRVAECSQGKLVALWPDSSEQGARNEGIYQAIQAARALCIAMDDHPSHPSLLPLGKLEPAIGLAHGRASTGTAGKRQGQGPAWIAAGSVMQLALRLAGLNQLYGTRILASQACHDLAATESQLRRLDQIQLPGEKGNNGAMRIWEVLAQGQAAGKAAHLELFAQGMEFFDQRAWAKAEDCFCRLMAAVPQDGPSRLFAARAGNFSRNPPPSGWKGIYRLSQ